MTVETNCQVDVELNHWKKWMKTELHLRYLFKKKIFKYMPYLQQMRHEVQ